MHNGLHLPASEELACLLLYIYSHCLALTDVFFNPFKTKFYLHCTIICVFLLQEKEEELPSRLEALKSLNTCGQELKQSEALSKVDRDNIKKDLDLISDRWNRVRACGALRTG